MQPIFRTSLLAGCILRKCLFTIWAGLLDIMIFFLLSLYNQARGLDIWWCFINNPVVIINSLIGRFCRTHLNINRVLIFVGTYFVLSSQYVKHKTLQGCKLCFQQQNAILFKVVMYQCRHYSSLLIKWLGLTAWIGEARNSHIIFLGKLLKNKWLLVQPRMGWEDNLRWGSGKYFMSMGGGQLWFRFMFNCRVWNYQCLVFGFCYQRQL